MSKNLKYAIKKYGWSNWKKVYDYVESYDDLLYVNIQHFKGNMKRSLTYLDSVIAEDSIDFIPQFIKLHKRYKLFTMDSQPSLCEESYLENGLHNLLEQKPYVCGLVHISQLDDFLYCLEQNPIIKYHIENYHKYNCNLNKIRLSNFKEKMVCVTREITDYSQIEEITFVRKGVDSDMIRDEYPNISDIVINECCFFQIFIDEYCTDYKLLNLLLSCPY